MVGSAFLVEDGIRWFSNSGGRFGVGTMCGCGGGITGWGERQGWRARLGAVISGVGFPR